MVGISGLWMRTAHNGAVENVPIVYAKESKNKLNKRERMQNPSLTLKIEMFGNLVEELGYWHNACNNDDGSDDEFEYCEQMFLDTLAAVRDMREVLLEDFNEYRNDCKVA